MGFITAVTGKVIAPYGNSFSSANEVAIVIKEPKFGGFDCITAFVSVGP